MVDLYSDQNNTFFLDRQLIIFLFDKIKREPNGVRLSGLFGLSR